MICLVSWGAFQNCLLEPHLCQTVFGIFKPQVIKTKEKCKTNGEYLGIHLRTLHIFQKSSCQIYKLAFHSPTSSSPIFSILVLALGVALKCFQVYRWCRTSLVVLPWIWREIIVVNFAVCCFLLLLNKCQWGDMGIKNQLLHHQTPSLFLLQNIFLCLCT